MHVVKLAGILFAKIRVVKVAGMLFATVFHAFDYYVLC